MLNWITIGIMSIKNLSSKYHTSLETGQTHFCRIDRGLTFKPNFREVSPRENRRQALYSQETIERVPANSNKSPKKKEEYTESPEAKKKFVNQKRLIGNVKPKQSQEP